MSRTFKKILLVMLTLLILAGTAYGLQTTLTGEADDMQGCCSIEVVKDGDNIISIKVIEGRENIEMNDEALRIYLDELVKAEDWNIVDAVSGATMSCDLIKKALFDAVQ